MALSRRTAGAATALLLLAYVAVRAQDEGTHPVSGRHYANTMSAAGAPWLDRDEREDEEAPKKAIALLGLKPGEVVADVGAGSGYFTLKMAGIVGPTGRVYASDIQQDMLDIIKAKMGSAPMKNVTLVLGDDENPKLPAGEIDTVLMVDVYHELHSPQAVLKHIRTALKPAGRLVLVEYREEDPNVPIQRLHKMSVATARLEVEHEGFTLSKVVSGLPWQHLLVFTKR
jgi:ubiquinone/menaquinone biosynthesis C-methylase UbiE